MAVDLLALDFVAALADWMAAQISPALKRTTPGIELFATSGVQRDAASVYSVLRHYAGDAAGIVPMRSLSLQWSTTAKKSATASAEKLGMLQAAAGYNVLRADYGPIRDQLLTGFLLKRVRRLMPPVPTQIDAENGQATIVFNFDVFYLPR